jgi:hypothetical protein
MTSERAAAYGRTMKTIGDMEAAKFHEAESAVLRNSADELFFANEETADYRESVTVVTNLINNLVANDRLVTETGQRLLDDILACGLTPALV